MLHTTQDDLILWGSVEKKRKRMRNGIAPTKLYWALAQVSHIYGVQVKVFWVAMPCHVALGYQCFRGHCEERYNPEEFDFNLHHHGDQTPILN
jgi:hypothetical protein